MSVRSRCRGSLSIGLYVSPFTSGALGSEVGATGATAGVTVVGGGLRSRMVVGAAEGAASTGVETVDVGSMGVDGAPHFRGAFSGARLPSTRPLKSNPVGRCRAGSDGPTGAWIAGAGVLVVVGCTRAARDGCTAGLGVPSASLSALGLAAGWPRAGETGRYKSGDEGFSIWNPRSVMCPAETDAPAISVQTEALFLARAIAIVDDPAQRPMADSPHVGHPPSTICGRPRAGAGRRPVEREEADWKGAILCARTTRSERDWSWNRGEDNGLCKFDECRSASAVGA
jgi:hypothetical protein